MNALAAALGLQEFSPGQDGMEERVKDGQDHRPARSRAGMDAGANNSPGLDPRSATSRQEAGALHGAAPCPAGAYLVRRCALHGGGAFRFFQDGAHRWHAIVSEASASWFGSEADARAAAHEHELADFTYYVHSPEAQP